MQNTPLHEKANIRQLIEDAPTVSILDRMAVAELEKLGLSDKEVAF